MGTFSSSAQCGEQEQDKACEFDDDKLSFSLFFSPFHFTLMLTARRILTPHNLRLLSGRVAAYHTLHEQQATILPNKVETASASFKVNLFLS